MLKIREDSLRAFFVLLFLIGAIANTVVYWSIAPFMVFLITLAATLAVVRLLGKGTSEERTAILIIFIISWFWAAVSASFLQILGPETQEPDSTTFYEFVMSPEISPIEDAVEAAPEDENISVWKIAYQLFAVTILQNAGAILVWRAAYSFFSFLHLGNGRYIGVTLNMAFVALSVAMGLRMLKSIYGADQVRIRRYIALCATCGMFWLFASLHLRDAMALFCVTFLALFWVYFLQTPGTKNLAALLAATLIGSLLFGLIRSEFVFVPFAMILAGSAAKIIGTRQGGRKRLWLYVGVSSVFMCALFAALLVFPSVLESIILLLEGREKIYSEVSAGEGAGSLGNQLIVNQTGLLKALFGSVYLLIFPIPFWSGIFSSAAYHMYKSFNALFMYMVLPMAAVGLWRMVQLRSLQSAPLLFVVFSFAGFTLAIAYTSIETRHLGAFLILLLLLAVVPDLSTHADRKMYKFALTILMAFIVPMHLVWLVYKALV